LISFRYVLELGLALGLLGNIRMIFTRESAIGLLDVVFGRIPLQTKDFIVVFVFHGTPDD
jgi:hypothetical protein